MSPASPAFTYPRSEQSIHCIARHRPHDCRDVGACQRALAAMCVIGEDRGERKPIPANSADMVLTPDEWRRRSEVAA